MMLEARMEDQPIPVEPPKRPRRRKKLLYKLIGEQMEFYFSDCNIAKDRFIAQQLEKDEFIPLSIFLSFNKIRRLTDKDYELRKAISISEILELSQDAMKVKRKTPVRVKENEEECTIYVERLPVETEHDWLKSVFSKFGSVDYVSIPRYKHNKIIKGFAFVEYSNPESAKRVLEYCEAIGCKLPTTMLPDQLISISSFQTEKEDVLNHFNDKKKSFDTDIKKDIDDTIAKNEIEDDKNDKEESEKDEPEKQESKKEKKRKRKLKKDIDDLENDDPVSKNKIEDDKNDIKEESEKDEPEKPETKKEKRKKRKLENEDNTKPINEDENKTKKLKTETETEDDKSDLEGESENKTEGTEGKMKRKRKKKKKCIGEILQYGLRVLSKREWKQLRNKYLNLQRQKMQNLKQHLYKNRFSTQNSVDTPAENSSELNTEDSKPRFEFTPGVIVHIVWPDAINDVKKAKNDIKSEQNVQYVDVKQGSNEGFIRFSDNASAKNFCEIDSINANKYILDGPAEKEYWDSIILQQRQQKFKRETKKKVRGRNKLLKKAEKALGKHIKFEAE